MITNTTLETERTKEPLEHDPVDFDGPFSTPKQDYPSGAAGPISGRYETSLEWVKKNPLRAAALGAGVGFVLGALVRRFASERSK